MNNPPATGKLELLSATNSALLLIDYQPSMIRGVGSGDKTLIRQAARGAARAAGILGIPVVLSTINPPQNGDFFPEITSLFPKQKPHTRKVPSFDALEDEPTRTALKNTGKKKVVISGLWTSMCFAYSAIHAIKDGY